MLTQAFNMTDPKRDTRLNFGNEWMNLNEHVTHLESHKILDNNFLKAAEQVLGKRCLTMTNITVYFSLKPFTGNKYSLYPFIYLKLV
jgi:hypothetical protein